MGFLKDTFILKLFPFSITFSTMLWVSGHFKFQPKFIGPYGRRKYPEQ